MLEMYLISPDRKYGLYITEGTGDNLLWEDEQEGYVDYWYWEWDDLEEGENDVDGGMWLTKYLIGERFEDIHDAFSEIERVTETDLSGWAEGERDW